MDEMIIECSGVASIIIKKGILFRDLILIRYRVSIYYIQKVVGICLPTQIHF